MGMERPISSIETPSNHFFLLTLAADLVTLPPDGSFLVTSLITPTATVCLISRTAKRPNGAYSENFSTHIAF